jgi:hypothetical protein
MISHVYIERASDSEFQFSPDSSGALSLDYDVTSHTYYFQLLTKLLSWWQLPLTEIPTMYYVSSTLIITHYSNVTDMIHHTV